MPRTAVVILVWLALTCGPPMRDSSLTRYQGMLLQGIGLGADAVESWQQGDPTLGSFLETAGPPDFVYVGGPDTIQLVYVRAAKVVLFHRTAPGTPSVMGERSPIPETLNALLPSNLVAQTPAAMPGLGVYCWRVPLETREYRTCCRTRQACSGEWRGR
jgi:hypothetical protein